MSRLCWTCMVEQARAVQLRREENCWLTVRIISYWENLTGDKLHLLLLKVFKLGLHPPVWKDAVTQMLSLSECSLPLGERQAGSLWGVARVQSCRADEQWTMYLEGAVGFSHVPSCFELEVSDKFSQKLLSPFQSTLLLMKVILAEVRGRRIYQLAWGWCLCYAEGLGYSLD